MHRRLRLLAPCALLALAACTGLPKTGFVEDKVVADVAVDATIAETWVAPAQSGDLDSLAVWTAEDGTAKVIATVKAEHRLQVFDADDGTPLERVGGKGPGPGAFLRPNGIAVFGDLVMVAERDNHRVQVLRLPAFEPLGSFGADTLKAPYGLWLNEVAPGELEAYVTDNYMLGADYRTVPPFDTLDRRVHRFRITTRDDDTLAFDALGTFGDTREATALRIVESIAGDAAHDRLLVADEDRRHVSTLREYTLDGRFTGGGVADGAFLGEAEGVALWACTADIGYWIAVDQVMPRTVFRLFDRITLAPRGTFRGAVTGFTDGIAVHAAGSRRFPVGALYAVHQDTAVAAFDLRDLVDALHLDRRCLE